jgi:hypothetical protein
MHDNSFSKKRRRRLTIIQGMKDGDGRVVEATINNAVDGMSAKKFREIVGNL